jgi:hypothetical protein
MARCADKDDRGSVTFGLAHPYRLAVFCVPGIDVKLDQIHAFMWLALKYQESGRTRLAKHTATYVRQHTLRLLSDWLAGADFNEEAIH